MELLQNGGTLTSLDSDEEFLGYVSLHSCTELGLFHRDQVLRLLKLANVEGRYFIPGRTFIGLSSGFAQPLVDRARRQLKRTSNPQRELPFTEDGAALYLL